MKMLLAVVSIIACHSMAIAQNGNPSMKETLLKEFAGEACKCVDSIEVYNKSKTEIAKEISTCINEKAGTYQMSSKLFQVNTSLEETSRSKKKTKGKKEINVTVDLNENSGEYKTYYYELERYMMANCPSLKEKMSRNEKQGNKSFSENPRAMEFYSKGVDEAKRDNIEKAIIYYKEALKEDPEFAFAWDNLGLCYRKMNDYDKAIEAYKKSLEIDPDGTMPLQNIAIAYQYKGEYQDALDSYQHLAELDKDNPEIYYGIGHIYTYGLKDYQKGLNNMCKAYKLYSEQKSPYRSDAEKVINYIYTEMKKENKTDLFNEILEANNIKNNDK